MMEGKELEDWVSTERSRVEEYLTNQGIVNPNVGPWPAFEIAPYFAIWAIESKKAPGRIGWWAFSGDIPTDYVAEDGKCHPRNALRRLLNNWTSYIPEMKCGNQPPNARFADSDNLPMLGDLLERRIAILEGWYNEDGLWEDR